jgi:molecular chaperone HtpG
MVHSVDSQTEIFLRELISKASDACDKLGYEAISTPDPMSDGAPLTIRMVPDAAAGTLTVADTGISMSHVELVENVGTIAKSGTKAFVDRLTEGGDGAAL